VRGGEAATFLHFRTSEDLSVFPSKSRSRGNTRISSGDADFEFQPVTDYPEWGFLWVSPSCSIEWQGSVPNYIKPLPYSSFTIHHSLIILPFHATQPELLTTSLHDTINKSRKIVVFIKFATRPCAELRNALGNDSVNTSNNYVTLKK
jgi:hypothetical protein